MVRSVFGDQGFRGRWRAQSGLAGFMVRSVFGDQGFRGPKRAQTGLAGFVARSGGTETVGAELGRSSSPPALPPATADRPSEL
jgi:hypothetical protein